MGNSNIKSDGNTARDNHVTRERQNDLSQFSLTNFIGNLSGRSFVSSTSNYSAYSSSRPWSRVSRRRWNNSTLTNPLSASKTAWPVANVEALFLPEFKVDSETQSKHFTHIDTISKGAFGKVYKVLHTDSNKLYALKVLSKSQIISENCVKQVKDEVHIQEVCGHNPFIVQCFLKWQSRKRLYIVTEFVPGGELLALLDKYCTLPEELVRLYVAEIALVIDFLHNAGIVYRDLKPENLLLDCLGHIQLIDFGLSKWLKFGCRTTTLCGTLRYMVFSLSMEGRQVDEAVASIFHTVLFHRSFGKFLYNVGGCYSISTLGYMDIDCDFIDFTYVCCSSIQLDTTLKKEISGFSELLRSKDGAATGQISLEFFQKKKKGWLFQTECAPWEVWTVRLELIELNSEDERQVCREKVGEMLQEKVFYITDVMNKHQYVPKIPEQSEADLIFDTSYEDVQPYLFKINYDLAGPSAPSYGNTMKKLIRETLAI